MLTGDRIIVFAVLMWTGWSVSEVQMVSVPVWTVFEGWQLAVEQTGSQPV